MDASGTYLLYVSNNEKGNENTLIVKKLVEVKTK